MSTARQSIFLCLFTSHVCSFKASRPLPQRDCELACVRATCRRTAICPGPWSMEPAACKAGQTSASPLPASETHLCPPTSTNTEIHREPSSEALGDSFAMWKYTLGFEEGADTSRLSKWALLWTDRQRCFIDVWEVECVTRFQVWVTASFVFSLFPFFTNPGFRKILKISCQIRHTNLSPVSPKYGIRWWQLQCFWLCLWLIINFCLGLVPEQLSLWIIAETFT